MPRPAGATIRLNIKNVPTIGTVMSSSSATSEQEAELHPVLAHAPRLGDVGEDRREQQRPEEDRDREEADDTEPGDRPELAPRDAEHLAEEQRVDLGRVLDAEGQEQRAEAEHEDERERGDDVVAPPPPEPADAERAEQGEDAEPERSCSRR